MTNCFDMRCPKCGGTDEIDIQAQIWIRLTSNGTDADAADGNGDHVFDNSSPAACSSCGYSGRLGSFEGPESSAK